ncbi:flagellar hook-associated protein FlgK [Pseudomonas fontis]|uniref:Flagellar hook-associated protein 1 n=1 Tax=Pseudomonas fontis TaxID=2942633 RepID=A0ABT5NQR8_9PSED|nr:flagellar hook-associated protein FlgK [Pseudomonas fontis]MDD0974552.1 flagellar hook-associated protein FlgK [Pseudomonas fontis]MDD0990505.1 flagellar hook-associated protein FlgK [Pseudomonas fontis]
MASLINIGMSGLGAASSGLYTTGNNITNADVAGYSRQQNLQSTKGSIRTGDVFIGTGTTLADVRRVYNTFLENQLRTTTSLNSDAAAYLSQVKPLDGLLSDPNTGITAALKSFFTAMQSAGAKPNEDASRQLLLTSAQSLGKRFNTIASQLNEQNTNLNGNLKSMTEQVNKLSATIAQFNEQISRIAAVGGAPNDLLDQRNETVRQLSELVGADAVERNGSVDVYLKNGQALVLGNTVNTLSTKASPSDPTRLSIVHNSGPMQTDITSSVTGGEIGGLLRYRSEVLDPSLNELGRVAMVVSDAINSQLAQGIDKNGEFGAALFNNINSAELISQRSIAKQGNSTGSGNLNVTIKDTGKLSTSDYQVTFTSATGYSVKKLPEGTDMGAFDLNDNPPKVIDGFSLSLNGGAMQAGDSFKVTPTRGGAGSLDTVLTDPKRIALAAPLGATSGASNKGTGVITQPTLTSKLDIYNSAQRLELQTGLKYSTPVKLVFGDEGTSPQTYEMYDAKGTKLSAGTIIPGEANKLQLNVPMVDASGAPIKDGAGVQKTFAFEMTVSGAPKKGDSYTVALTGSGSNDNRNGQSVIDLQSKGTVEVGANGVGISLTDAYGKLVENVGGKTAQAQMDSSSTTALNKSAQAARDSLSGVQLDEEAGNLVKYQQYYTASSQIIKAAQEIFSTLINSL